MAFDPQRNPGVKVAAAMGPGCPRQQQRLRATTSPCRRRSALGCREVTERSENAHSATVRLTVPRDVTDRLSHFRRSCSNLQGQDQGAFAMAFNTSGIEFLLISIIDLIGFRFVRFLGKHGYRTSRFARQTRS